MRRFLFLILMASVALAGCEGARNNSSWSEAEEGAEVVPKLTQPAPVDTAAVDSVPPGSSQDHH